MDRESAADGRRPCHASPEHSDPARVLATAHPLPPCRFFSAQRPVHESLADDAILPDRPPGPGPQIPS